MYKRHTRFDSLHWTPSVHEPYKTQKYNSLRIKILRSKDCPIKLQFHKERTIEENSPSTALNPSGAVINKEYKLRFFVLHITNYPHNCNLNKIQNSRKPIIRKQKKWMQLSVSIKPTVLTSAPSMLALDSSLLDNSLNCLTVIGSKVRTLRFCTTNLFINTHTHTRVHTRNDEN